jgi:hypothetical protein
MFISAKVIQCISCYILFIQVQNPGKISLMMSNYDFLTISKYIHLYPVWISISDILGVILFGYPERSFLSMSYIQGKYPWWYPIMISWLYPSISMFSPLISHLILWVTWIASSDSYSFISQHLSFHIITVMLSYLVIYSLIRIKG